MYTIELSSIARFDPPQSARSFVDFWSKFYVDEIRVAGTEERIDYFTELNIANDLTEENVRRLLRWKDPRLLTHRILDGPKKGEDNPKVVKVLDCLGLINQFRNDQTTEANIQRTTEHVFTDGIVWKAFLLHIAKPHIYPIADQNVFRVWSLHTGLKNDQTWATYASYCDCFSQIAIAVGVDWTVQNIRQLKRIDDALLVFGQFLDSYRKALPCPVA
jgi:hypothetical protein